MVLRMIKLRRSKELKALNERIERLRIINKNQEYSIKSLREYNSELIKSKRLLLVKIENLENQLEQVKADLQSEVENRNLERLNLINRINEGRTKVIL